MAAEHFGTIEQALDDLRHGRMIILCDDPDRENEGDLVMAAEHITPLAVNFMLTHARGVLCLAMERKLCERLNLPLQTSNNTAKFSTAFTVTIDAHPRFGVTTGVSANDRAKTILLAVDDNTRPADLNRPGHINPLQAVDGGVLVRSGQTEGSVDLCRLAGLKPAGVIIEIMNEDGSMARVPDLATFAQRHGLNMYTVADLIEYRMKKEDGFISRGVETKLPTEFGQFKLIEYRSPVDIEPHLALCCGGVGELDADGKPIIHEEDVLVRVESECMTGHVFRSARCDCGQQLAAAMQMIQQQGKGAIIYLRQEGRGIGLHNKLLAYKLQDEGMDTVEANEHLGLPADRRDYGIGAQIIRNLGLRSLRILTNNPKKVNRLEVYGIRIAEQLPIEVAANDHNQRYLLTKKTKLGHTLKGI